MLPECLLRQGKKIRIDVLGAGGAGFGVEGHGGAAVMARACI